MRVPDVTLRMVSGETWNKQVEEKPARSTAQSAPSGPAADPHRIYRIS